MNFALSIQAGPPRDQV